jgi:ubiquinone/menaquinone biosynthesis C-methylase UbiE
MNKKPIASGKSSFDLIDRNKVISELHPEKGTVILDAACGTGNYSVALSGLVGDKGTIYAIDLWEEGINTLKKTITEKGIRNIKPITGDVSDRIPLEDESVDLCLMATVLHDLIEVKTSEGALKEVKRVLKPGGRLAVIEFKKIDGHPGPPVAIRLAPRELDDILSAHGFKQHRVPSEVGPYNYLSIFTK